MFGGLRKKNVRWAILEDENGEKVRRIFPNGVSAWEALRLTKELERPKPSSD